MNEVPPWKLKYHLDSLYDEWPDLDDGQWHHHSAIVPQVVGRDVRDAIEAHFRERGYEVLREKRQSSGQRFRGLWVRRPEGVSDE